MMVSSTTRPLLGCVWNFPSAYSGLAYATTSMVIHEIVPIILMAITNLGSLYTLYSHGRTSISSVNAPIMKKVPAEKRAAKVVHKLRGSLCEHFTLTFVLSPPVCSLSLLLPHLITLLDLFLLFLGHCSSHHALYFILGDQHDLSQLL